MNDVEGTIPLRMKDSKPFNQNDRAWREKQIALSISGKVNILDQLNDGWHLLRGLKNVKRAQRSRRQ